MPYAAWMIGCLCSCMASAGAMVVIPRAAVALDVDSIVFAYEAISSGPGILLGRVDWYRRKAGSWRLVPGKASNTIFSVPVDRSLGKATQPSVLDIAVDRNGTLWALSYDGGEQFVVDSWRADGVKGPRRAVPASLLKPGRRPDGVFGRNSSADGLLFAVSEAPGTAKDDGARLVTFFEANSSDMPFVPAAPTVQIQGPVPTSAPTRHASQHLVDHALPFSGPSTLEGFFRDDDRFTVLFFDEFEGPAVLTGPAEKNAWVLRSFPRFFGLHEGSATYVEAKVSGRVDFRRAASISYYQGQITRSGFAKGSPASFPVDLPEMPRIYGAASVRVLHEPPLRRRYRTTTLGPSLENSAEEAFRIAAVTENHIGENTAADFLAWAVSRTRWVSYAIKSCGLRLGFPSDRTAAASRGTGRPPHPSGSPPPSRE